MEQLVVGSLFVVKTPHTGMGVDNTVYICLRSGKLLKGGLYYKIYRLSDFRFVGNYWDLDLFELMVLIN